MVGVGDQIIKGDWQGTGTDGIAIFRPATGYWYFDYNLDGVVDNSFRYGGVGDQIIQGDWQGTGTDGIAIFRPATGYGNSIITSMALSITPSDSVESATRSLPENGFKQNYQKINRNFFLSLAKNLNRCLITASGIMRP